MTYDCMTPDELALWRASSSVSVPCYDCPAWFRATERAAGRCRQPSPERLAAMRRYARERKAA